MSGHGCAPTILSLQNNSRHLMDRRLGKPHGCCKCDGEEKTVLIYCELNLVVEPMA